MEKHKNILFFARNKNNNHILFRQWNSIKQLKLIYGIQISSFPKENRKRTKGRKIYRLSLSPEVSEPYSIERNVYNNNNESFIDLGII